MFQIKICGVTSVDDARMVRDAGADAIGLNFFQQSPRYVAPDVARQIVNAVGGDLQIVGVFVNAALADMRQLAADLPLHLIQLHGDETVELSRDLVPHKFIRAFRLCEGDTATIATYFSDCRKLGLAPSAILIDAYQRGKYGGTGKTVNWDALTKIREIANGVDIVLAGGLVPGNVAEAIGLARPDGVDVAGGVESSPGHKDGGAVESFVTAARRAFQQLSAGQDHN